MGTAARLLIRPLGWPTTAMAVLALVLLGWSARLPGGDPPYLFAGLLLWMWVVAVWLVRPLLRLAILKWHGHPTRLYWRGWIHWGLVPTLLALNGWLLASGLPFWIAFSVSRPAMDRLAQGVLADGRERSHQWVGVFPISRARLKNGAVEFTLDKKELLWGEDGFYFAQAPVRDTHYYGQEPLGDGWYMWHYGGW